LFNVLLKILIKMMRKRLPVLLALFLVAQLLTAQIKIVGANFDLGTNTISVIRWNANTGGLLDSVPTPTQGIAIGSSVFDAYAGKYYFADGNGLNGIQLGPNTFTSYAGTQISTSAEIDMANGKIFGVRLTNVLDSSGMLISSSMDMVEFNISNNTETVLGTFAGNQGVYLDASCYNSNLGIYYFVGVDSVLGECLYAVNTQASAFAFTLVPLSLSGVYAITLEYDNEHNILYALMMDTNTPGSSHFLIQKIDPTTGALTMEANFPQYHSYQIGSCSFHQASSSMVFVFPDTTGTILRIYDTVNDTMTNGVLPIPIINEFECDNTEYAATKYNTTAVKSPLSQARMGIFPNPATHSLQVVAPGKVLQVQVVDALGQVMPIATTGDMNTVDVSQLRPGYYILRSLLADGRWTEGKFIKL
jgi:hypothetical protein